MGYDFILKNTMTGTARGSEDVRVGVSDRLILIVLFNNFKLIVARKSLCRMSVRHIRTDGRICCFLSISSVLWCRMVLSDGPENGF